MIIKKFIGKTEEEAAEAAKKELGNGIVIMNVKSVKPKGIFSAFRSKLTEVTVALEEENEMAAPVHREEAPKSQRDTVAGGEQKLRISNAENIEKKLDSLQILLENQLKSTEIKKQSVIEKNEDADGEVEEADGKASSKPVKQEESPEKSEENKEQEKFIRLLYNTMLDNEVDEKYANQMIEDIEKSKKPNMPFDYILANVYQKMILKFGKTQGITPAKKGPKVVMFIGPTGVGKTTTIAKLASRYAVDEKKKVALLTTDTYRIAAAEQLRTYANILEVPFRVIYTKEELQNALTGFKDYDYIFVDTAGHSHQNEKQLEDMKALLSVLTKPEGEESVEYQCFLVLSATTKYRDLLKIADNYRAIAEYQLIFTKLDETTTLGSLFNLRLTTESSIAYVTYGQNVPDDIEPFNPQKTVKQLLGGKH